MWRIVFLFIAAHLAVGLGALVGGYRDVDVNSRPVQDVLNYAVVKHNEGTNDLYLRKVAEVERVQSQVRDGQCPLCKCLRTSAQRRQGGVCRGLAADKPVTSVPVKGFIFTPKIPEVAGPNPCFIQ